MQRRPAVVGVGVDGARLLSARAQVIGPSGRGRREDVRSRPRRRSAASTSRRCPRYSAAISGDSPSGRRALAQRRRLVEQSPSPASQAACLDRLDQRFEVQPLAPRLRSPLPPPPSLADPTFNTRGRMRTVTDPVGPAHFAVQVIERCRRRFRSAPIRSIAAGRAAALSAVPERQMPPGPQPRKGPRSSTTIASSFPSSTSACGATRIRLPYSRPLANAMTQRGRHELFAVQGHAVRAGAVPERLPDADPDVGTHARGSRASRAR